MAELRWGAASDAGRIRASNEDNLLVTSSAFVVADGMGGHEAGEVASQLAVDRIASSLDGDGLPTADQVVSAISDANGDIFRAAIANPHQHGMGTTVTAIAVIGDAFAGRAAPNVDVDDPEDNDPGGDATRPAPSDVTPIVPAEPTEALVLANVGDSRTYLFRHDRLRPVTVDHSYVQELVATGHITDTEARSHPRRNIITRALGIEPEVKVDWWTLPLIRGDRFLLCSDGLVDEVDDDEIAAALIAECDDPQSAAEHLVEMANAAGGRDNVTVIVVDVLEGDDPPDPTLELDVVPVWADEGADPTPAGTLEVDADPGAAPAPLPAVAAPMADGRARRRRALKRAAIGFGVAAAAVIVFVVVAAWARSGYFVQFDDADEVIIYQGQPDGVLWFDPTAETPAGPAREELTDESVERVDARPTFDARSDADEFVRSLELATTTTSTTTTTTSTTVPATTAPASSAPTTATANATPPPTTAGP